jgi:hypothetical protein
VLVVIIDASDSDVDFDEYEAERIDAGDATIIDGVVGGVGSRGEVHFNGLYEAD